MTTINKKITIQRFIWIAYGYVVEIAIAPSHLNELKITK